ncbi:MAG: hypothetical protein Kow00127_03590 [Bacteroidales bacterium]
MDLNSAFLIVASIVGFIILVVVLILLLYKPKKKLEVEVIMKPEIEGLNVRYITIKIKNPGKEATKIQAPYIHFYNLKSSQIFQIDPKKVHCKFPRVIKVGEEVTCDVEIGHYKPILEKREFHATKLKVSVMDMAGFEFHSHGIDYHS